MQTMTSIAFVGFNGSGKTSIIRRITDGTYEPLYSPTKKIELHETKFCAVNDCPGNIHMSIPSDTKVCVIVADATKRLESERSCDWVRKIIRECGDNTSIILVRNKMDSPEADTYNINTAYCCEDLLVSARDNIGIRELFDVIYKRLNN